MVHTVFLIFSLTWSWIGEASRWFELLLLGFVTTLYWKQVQKLHHLSFSLNNNIQGKANIGN